MKKKNIVILTTVLTIVIIFLIVMIYYLFSIRNKEIKYSCGKAVDGRTDIYYINKKNKDITRQQITAIYYDDANEYIDDAMKLYDNENVTFDDKNLIITISWQLEEYKDKNLDDILKEVEDLGYTCKKDA